MDKQTAAYYEDNAKEISAMYESIDSPFEQLFPHFITKDNTVLDIGCGSARDLSMLHLEGCDVYGLEPSERLIEKAKQLHPELVDRIFQGSLPSNFESVTDRKFDAILLSAVIMHIPNLELFQAAFTLINHLQDKGTLIISHCINRNGLNTEHRDSKGRLYILRSSMQIELLLENLGLRKEHTFIQNDNLGRDDIQWETLIFTYDGGKRSESIDRIETIINNDRKTASYKLALLRSLCAIAQKEPHLAQWTQDGNIDIPLDRIADLWIEYYLPLIGYKEFVPQNRGENLNSKRPVAFRKYLCQLAEIYPSTPAGLAQFVADRDRDKFPEKTDDLYTETIKKITTTIIKGPVHYTSGNIFQYNKSKKSITIKGELWRELVILGHWIENSLIIKWAELINTFSRSTKPFPVTKSIELLLMQPQFDRWVTPAKNAFKELKTVQCVWSNKTIHQGILDIDHAIPFFIRHDNSLWNLLPSDGKINRLKSDKLPTNHLLSKQKDLIIYYWQHLYAKEHNLFTIEASRFMGEKVFPKNNWENQLYTTFIETIEHTAFRRDVERWSI